MKNETVLTARKICEHKLRRDTDAIFLMGYGEVNGAMAELLMDLLVLVNKRHRVFRCQDCPEIRPEEFRASEPKRCKACRRAYNAKRKRELVDR